MIRAVSYHDAVLSLNGPLIVRAVFDRAWHLHDSGDRVMTVTTAPYNGPMAIRVAAPLPFMQPGTRGRLAGTVLRVGDLRISLDQATPWSPRDEHLPHLLATLWEGLARIEPLSALSDEGSLFWHGRAEEQMRSLREALVGGDAGVARVHARGLLGLGPGLTPSGDDILIGLLVGLHVLGRRIGGRDVPDLGEWIWREARERTTPLSRTLLYWAARGVAVQPLLDVLWSLGSERPTGVLDELLAIGHSSGRDMLVGASLAASVILGREEQSGPAMVGPPQRLSRLR